MKKQGTNWMKTGEMLLPLLLYQMEGWPENEREGLKAADRLEGPMAHLQCMLPSALSLQL